MARRQHLERLGHRQRLFLVGEQGRERLAQGFWIVVFPEGTTGTGPEPLPCPHAWWEKRARRAQPYDKHGEPDKTSGHDHPVDAAGYYIHYRWPLVKPAMQINMRMAM